MIFTKKFQKIFLFYIKFFFLILLIFLIIFIIKEKSDDFPYTHTIKKLTLGNGKSMKIGMISDFQISSETNRYGFNASDNLIQSLKVLKKNKVDLIIFPGDITDEGNPKSFDLVQNIINLVYNETNMDKNEKIPKILSLLGNHDYKTFLHQSWPLGKKIPENLFRKYSNGEFPYSHYLINNYHFIIWSDYSNHSSFSRISFTNSTFQMDIDWVKHELKVANKTLNKKGDPIFVVTHFHPGNTVYGSRYWGKSTIYEVLKEYSNVISISGHSHYSLRNEKSIWQEKFTAVNVQTTTYSDCDYDFINRKKMQTLSYSDSYMGIIATLDENKMVMDRIYLKTEEVLEKKWIINFPIDPNNFIYSNKIRNNSQLIKAPIFLDLNTNKNKEEFILITKKDKKSNKTNYYIQFNSAYHKDFVYMYQLILKNKNSKNNAFSCYKNRYDNKFDNYNFYYYSDYHLIPQRRKNTTVMYLPSFIKKGSYNVEIYAVETFGRKSVPKCGNITLI